MTEAQVYFDLTPIEFNSSYTHILPFSQHCNSFKHKHTDVDVEIIYECRPHNNLSVYSEVHDVYVLDKL